MSAGAFSDVKYESNEGGIHPADAQPETVALDVDGTVNALPTGPLTSKIPAKVSGSPRSKQLTCRRLTVQFGTTPGSFPDGYLPGGKTNLPWFVKSTFDSIIVPSDAIYLGINCRITGKRGERPE